MSYVRFGLMILTSTVVMFILMYLNTYAWEHVFFSETRVYMAIVMGATMAVIMLGYMLGMYENMTLNAAIFAGSIIVFALALWLVRSQVTISGESYMRAMIPHHSIAIMTSERARIEDPRVRKLADEIIEAQRREIAEMRYLVREISSDGMASDTYEDPPPEPGSVEDALASTVVSTLDPAPLAPDEADRLLEPGARCMFDRSAGSDPILWASADGGDAAIKLNGILIELETDDEPKSGNAEFTAPGATVHIRALGEEADWRGDSEFVLELQQGPTVGYIGFYGCSSSER